MAKQTRITIETDSLLIVQGRNSRRAWCSRCSAEVDMIALEDTGVISNLERPELEEWLKSGINDRGDVVGTSEYTDGTVHPFLWTKATGMHDLGYAHAGGVLRP